MNVPLVSMLMTTYRHGRWIEAALEGALSQDWPSLELLVRDDCSDDDTWSRIQAVVADYDGPIRVRLHRNDTNLGAFQNLAAAYVEATGRWFVLCDGDDISEPKRVSRLVQTGIRHSAGLVSSNARLIDEGGAVQGLYRPAGSDRGIGLDEIIAKGWQWEMLGATFAFRREIFDAFGPFEQKLIPSSGDHVLPLRAALLFPGAMRYIGEPLLRYRQHPAQRTRAVGDRTQTSLIAAETMQGINAACAMQKLRDLQHYRRINPGDPRTSGAIGGQIQHLVAMMNDWTLMRNQLLNQALRPTWVDAGTLAALPSTPAFTPIGE